LEGEKSSYTYLIEISIPVQIEQVREKSQKPRKLHKSLRDGGDNGGRFINRYNIFNK